jgi:hypothetical protein
MLAKQPELSKEELPKTGWGRVKGEHPSGAYAGAATVA